MPLLDDDMVAYLRAEQAQDALDHKLCDKCTAQLWKNYCRQCDEYFTDGHYETCAEATKYQSNHHRTY